MITYSGFRYKCPLTNYNIWLSRKICRWHGDIEDYIAHVKTCHPENFFVIQKHGRFMWKLPNYGDQQDIGIIKYNSNHYIFEMFYSEKSGKLYFSLNNISDLQSSASGYVFNLENRIDRTCTYIQTIHGIKEILKPIEERSATTQLHTSDIKRCALYYGHFMWKIIIT